MKKTLKKISKLVFGKKYSQPLFELLYKISLKGMNFGDSETEDSGEKYVLEYLKNKNLEEDFVIFDAGANLGQYATLANKVFSDKAHIYSFEPGKETFSQMSKNTSTIKNIQRCNFALGASVGVASLNYDKEGSGLASVYERKLDHANISLDTKEEIEVKTVDSVCVSNNINHIDFLKMDVEGHELEILKGASNMLDNKKISALQFEFGGANIDSRTYFQDFYYLLEKNYKIYRVLQDGLQEIKKYSELQEIFTTVNYFAELK
ncbi:MAG: FkbM family methyltransferase [Candidatus Paceibacterota bacterium]|jgi:FkbM family methyltransferase